MSVLIRGMEMPKSCDKCIHSAWSNFYQIYVCNAVRNNEPVLFDGKQTKSTAVARSARADNCPLVPVPTHGRLGDLDALMRHCVMLPRDGGSLPVVYASYVRNAPTIIPAEEKGENFCADCHWYESEQQYCFRKGCHTYDESSCELWEPMPADEPIPAEGGEIVPTTYDLLYEEGGYSGNGI